MNDYQYKCIQILLCYKKGESTWEEVITRVEAVGDKYNLPATKRYSLEGIQPRIDKKGTMWFIKDGLDWFNNTEDELDLNLKNSEQDPPPANILKIDTLGESWRDKDVILLHACFQLLTDFVEKEMLVQNYPDWNADEDIKNARKEIEELYNWWQERKNNDLSKESFEEEHTLYLKENEMLKRLIDVRMYMWT